MSRKTLTRIVQVVVVLLVVMLVLTSIIPYVGAATSKYKNKDMGITVRIPSEYKSTVSKVGDNSFTATVSFNTLLSVTVGDLYQETLEKLRQKEIKAFKKSTFGDYEKELQEATNMDAIQKKYTRSKLWLGCGAFDDTWNKESYVKNYAASILKSSESKYKVTVSETKLNGIPAWQAKYTDGGKSQGSLFFTIFSCKVYSFNVDAYDRSKEQLNKDISAFKKGLVIEGASKFEAVKLDKLDDNSQNKSQDRNKQEKTSAFMYILIGIGALIVVAIIILIIINISQKKKRKRNPYDYY